MHYYNDCISYVDLSLREAKPGIQMCQTSAAIPKKDRAVENAFELKDLPGIEPSVINIVTGCFSVYI